MHRFFQWAANAFPLWLLLFCASAMVFPGAFVWFSGPWIVWGLAVIMLGMGVTLHLDAFRQVAQMPKAVAAGFLLQFTIMPLAGWSVAWMLGLSPAYAVGLILMACSPGGTASNVVAFIAKANVALSVTMTVASTLGAVVLTPLLTKWLADAYVPVDAWGIFRTTLQVIILPVVLGLVLHHRFPSLARPVSVVGPLVSVLVISMICASIVAQSRESLLQDGPRLLLAVGMVHGFGFLVGWLIAVALRFGPPEARAISIEVGMQNSGLAAVLARQHFSADPLTAVPAALSSVMHSLIGSFLAALWRTKPSGWKRTP